MHYRKEIDGLRAVAVLPVILFHAGVGPFSGGYLGVDVFFVISGYLITGLLLGDLVAGQVSILRFYERRARRILPALFVVMLACLPLAYVWMLSFEFREFGQSVVAVALFVSNLFFWKTTDYFGTLAEVKPLLHTWSLGVEEQFYLVFPLVLLAVWRLGRRFALGAVVLAMLASFAIANWSGERMPIAAFYLLPTRAWELLAGSVCAFVLLGRPQRAQGGLAALGLAMIVVPVFVFDAETVFLGAFALVPVMGTVLVILFAAPQTLAGRLLSARPLVGIGLMSYSAYLWHQPVFAFARIALTDKPGPLVAAGLMLLVFVLAYGTWRWVETPFRGNAPLLPGRAGLFGAAALAGGALALAGAVIVSANGFDGRSNGRVTMGELAALIAPNPGLRDGCTTTNGGDTVCVTGPAPKILLWGDSFAMHLGKGIEASAKGRAFAQITLSQCAPLLDIAQRKDWISGNSAETCIDFNQRVLDYIRDQRIEVVIMSSALGLARWRIAMRGNVEVPGRSPDIVAEHLAQTVAAVRAAGARVVFVSPTPDSGRDVARCAVRSIYALQPETSCDFDLATETVEYDLLRQIEDQVPIYWLYRDICPEGRCKAREGDLPIYRDQGHLSMAGSRLLGARAGWMDGFLLLAR